MSDPTVVFDLDGTLLDLKGIRAWAKGERSDYETFHRIALQAPVIPWVREVAWNLVDQGFCTVVMTAREAIYWRKTEAWLDKHDIPYKKLVMRPQGDTFSDLTVKTSMVAALVSQGHEIKLAFEDNPDLLKIWVSLGVPCVLVPGWDED